MENEAVSKNFIEQIIDKDIAEGHCKKVITRFPPEPNGYLHIGHAKSILLNYGLSQEYGGQFNLRFDDTNPTKEKVEFVDSIKRDVEWLGAKWHGDVLFASDYFDRMYEAAVKLIRKGKAYVCDLTFGYYMLFENSKMTVMLREADIPENQRNAASDFIKAMLI